jgi:ketosteroid isomerase-like protein
MAPRFSYRFYGDSTLSGERHTTEAVRRWWQRSFRLMPRATFDVLDIVVSGSPRNTSIATAVAVHGTLADGSSYENIFNQFMHMSGAALPRSARWRTPRYCNGRWTG